MRRYETINVQICVLRDRGGAVQNGALKIVSRNVDFRATLDNIDEIPRRLRDYLESQDDADRRQKAFKIRKAALARKAVRVKNG